MTDSKNQPKPVDPQTVAELDDTQIEGASGGGWGSQTYMSSWVG